MPSCANKEHTFYKVFVKVEKSLVGRVLGILKFCPMGKSLGSSLSGYLGCKERSVGRTEKAQGHGWLFSAVDPVCSLGTWPTRQTSVVLDTTWYQQQETEWPKSPEPSSV